MFKETAMFFISAMDAKSQGIGKDGKLCWYDDAPEDLKFFREKTLGKNVIVGHETYKYLPKLDKRNVMVLSNKKGSNFYTLDELCKAVEKMETKVEEGLDSVVVCGGLKTYMMILREPRLYQYLTHGFVSHLNFESEKQYDTYLTDFYNLLKNRSIVQEEHELPDGTKVESFWFKNKPQEKQNDTPIIKIKDVLIDESVID